MRPLNSTDNKPHELREIAQSSKRGNTAHNWQEPRLPDNWNVILSGFWEARGLGSCVLTAGSPPTLGPWAKSFSFRVSGFLWAWNRRSISRLCPSASPWWEASHKLPPILCVAVFTGEAPWQNPGWTRICVLLPPLGCTEQQHPPKMQV